MSKIVNLVVTLNYDGRGLNVEAFETQAMAAEYAVMFARAHWPEEDAENKPVETNVVHRANEIVAQFNNHWGNDQWRLWFYGATPILSTMPLYSEVDAV